MAPSSFYLHSKGPGLVQLKTAFDSGRMNSTVHLPYAMTILFFYLTEDTIRLFRCIWSAKLLAKSFYTKSFDIQTLHLSI